MLMLRSARAIKNMLSTPIARIKNGTTSALIMVSSWFPKKVRPMPEKSDMSTTLMPTAPRRKRVCTGFGKNPIAIETYMNMSKYEMTTMPPFYLPSNTMLSSILLSAR